MRSPIAVWSRGLTLALLLSSPLVALALPRPVTIEESQQLASPDPQLPFNGPVALDGNALVAGSAIEVEAGLRCAVFLFERTSSSSPWSFTQKLADFVVTPDRGNHLSVAISENIVAVGAANVAYAIERTATGWITTSLPRPSGAEDYGSDVAVARDAMVVGGTANAVTGYVFVRSGPGVWSFDAELRGGAVACCGSNYLGPDVDIGVQNIGADGFSYVALIGSPADPADFENSGVTYVFRREAGGGWFEVSQLRPAPWRPSGPSAGEAVSLSRSAFFVAMNSGIRGGGASLFIQEVAPGYFNTNSVRPLDNLMNRLFESLDMGEGRIALGSPGDEDRGVRSGSIALFQSDGENFFQVAELLASNSRADLILGRRVALHGDTVVAHGGQRIYVFRAPQTLAAFDVAQDDFEDGDAAGWRPTASTWGVATASGSRVYQQTSADGDRRSTLGGVDWTNVAIEADLRPLAFNGADRWAGLITRYVDDANNYYVALRNTNVVQLVRRSNGVNRVLASASLTVTPNRNYRVRLEAIGTWIRVYVDGRLRLQARDSTLTRGTVGLRTVFASARFDNVIVSPSPAVTLLSDDFNDSSGSLDVAWATQPQGAWSVATSGSARVARQTFMGGAARAISGIEYFEPDNLPADHMVEARARALSFIPDRDPWFGLIARYRDDANYIYITVNRNGYISLRKLNDGVIQVFDTAPMTVTTGAWYTLRLEAVGERLRVYVNGALVLEGVDNAPTADGRGLYGLMTSRASAEFDHVRVTQP